MSYLLLAILKIVQNVCMYYLKNMFHTTRDLISSNVCVVCRFDDNKIPLIYVPLHKYARNSLVCELRFEALCITNVKSYDSDENSMYVE